MSASGNPVRQMLRYITKIREKDVKMWDGRSITVYPSTKFFCYAICDLDKPMRRLLKEMNLRETPDTLGFYGYMNDPDYNAYIEVISYNKLIDDAKRRNRILFEKLRIFDYQSR